MKTTIIVTCNAARAVLLPKELRFPETVKTVEIRARGNEMIISPIGKTWDSFFVDGPHASEDAFFKRAAQSQAIRDSF
jgi:antitoxin VapB